MPTKVTVKDVAALARVSVGTVSNVVNHPERVAAETLGAVERAIATLGWSRHQVARQLRSGRTTAIGVVVAELSPLTVSLLETVQSGLSSSGLVLQITVSGAEQARELERIELFKGHRVRGVLLSPVQAYYQTQLEQLHRLAIPIVLLNPVPTQTGLCSAGGDDVAGGRIAMEHLKALGHHRIALAGGQNDDDHVQARRSGAESAAAGVDVMTLPTDTYGVSAGSEVAHSLLHMTTAQRPTAIIGVNDLVAVGVQHGLLAAGVKIPDQVAVVGYDDIPLAAAAPVPLTTISHQHDEIALSAASLLLLEIAALEDEENHSHRQVRLPPELVVRTSTDPAR